MHYNPYTGQKCSCPWGREHSKHKQERYGTWHFGGEHMNKLLKAPDKKYKTPEGQQFLQALQREVGDEHDSLAPFLANRWKRGEVQQANDNSLWIPNAEYRGYEADNFNADSPEGKYTHKSLARTLPKWHQWYEARQHPLRQGVNVMDPKFSVHDLNQKAAEHQKDLEHKRQIREDLSHGEVVKKWPDGWHVRHLNADGHDSTAALEGEGTAMNHCVGSESQPYQECARDGSINVYSLRDAKGWPHGTWHTNSDGSVAEVFGHADSGLKGEHQERYEEWCEENDTSPHEVGHQEEGGYDQTIQLPAADDVTSYLDLHSQEGEWSEYQPPDANPGEDTEYEWQDPEHHNVAHDLIENQPESGYNYRERRSLTPAETRGQVFDTALTNHHLPDLHQAIQEHGDPDDPDHQAALAHWNQMYNQHVHPMTGQFVQPGYNDKPVMDQFQPPLFEKNMIQGTNPWSPKIQNPEHPYTYAKTKTKTAMHKHITKGHPCNCPWGEIHNHERIGSVREASKLEWLQNRPDVQSDPHKNLIVNHVLPRLPANVDPLLPWLMREHKKGRIALDEGTKNRLEIAQEAAEQAAQTGDPDHHAEAAHFLEHAQSRARSFGHLRHTEADIYHPADEVRMSLHDALPQYADMLDDHAKRRKGIDVMQHDTHSLHDTWSQWETERAAKERQDMGNTVHDFGDGWTMRQLQNREELQDEGNHMGHCVGGHGDPEQIYSLRDHKNMPHATVEVHHDGGVKQVQGKENQEPISEYQARLGEWFGNGRHANGEHFHAMTTERSPIHIDNPDEYLDYLGEDGGWYDDQDEQDPYQISRYQAEEYGLHYDDEPSEVHVDYKGVVHKTMNPPRYMDTPTPAKAAEVHEIASQRGEGEDLWNATKDHVHPVREKFYNYYHDPNLPWSEHQQWEQYPEAQILHGLHGGYAPLHEDDPHQPPAKIQPNQRPLFAPQLEFTPEHPDDMDRRGYPAWGPRDTPGPVYASTKTAAPLYYRWAFSPQDGEVKLSHNEDGHPSEVAYHGSLGGDNAVHGYAYRIGGGWRLTDWDHKPVADPYVYASVVRGLRQKETSWDFESAVIAGYHYGMPISSILQD